MFLGRDDVAQVAVAKAPISDKGHRADMAQRSLTNLENQIHPVLGQLHHFRFNPDVKAASGSIGRLHAIDILQRAVAGENQTLAQAHLAQQRLIVDPQIPLEGNPIDNWVFNHLDHQHIAALAKSDIGEQPRRK